MERADREYYERMLTLTTYPEWGELVEELKKEIYQEQSNVFDACKTWDDVVRTRGRVEKMAELVNFKDTIRKVLDNV